MHVMLLAVFIIFRRPGPDHNLDASKTGEYINGRNAAVWEDHLDKLSCTSKGQRPLFRGCQNSHFGLRRRLVWKTSETGRLCPLNNTNSQPQMQTWDPFSSISTPTRNLCQVTSIVYVIWWDIYSFNPKPLVVMTPTFFHAVWCDNTDDQ